MRYRESPYFFAVLAFWPIPRKQNLAPVVGTWCETSDDFDLLIELIAHALADKETSMLRVAHDQAVARQRQKLTAD